MQIAALTRLGGQSSLAQYWHQVCQLPLLQALSSSMLWARGTEVRSPRRQPR